MQIARQARRAPATLLRRMAHARLRRTAAGLLQRVGVFVDFVGATLAAVSPNDMLAGAAGIGVAALTLDPLDAMFVSAWWPLVLVVMRSDIADYIIPDEASLAIATFGLLHAAAAAMATGSSLAGSALAVAGAAGTGLGAAALLWAIGRIFRLVRGHDGLGFGDMKLAGASAIWLAPTDACLALQLAAVAALGAAMLDRRMAADDQDGALPFGAFLAPAAWMVGLARLTAPDLLGALAP
ncbi:MAG TPA: prepilin peptidase [Rhodopseudomonas sp.]|uniref:prepilin peptidase n=1 Tax=Rhodopseudomonas sp. TaxID=1078 RepID=UPI002EDB00FF